MALPSIQCRKLFMDEEPTISKSKPDTCPKDEAVNPLNSSVTVSVPEVSTPKPLKRRFLSPSKVNESFEQTPEALHESPSSVLNPPSSLKRKTIRDYFLATS